MRVYVYVFAAVLVAAVLAVSYVHISQLAAYGYPPAWEGADDSTAQMLEAASAPELRPPLGVAYRYMMIDDDRRLFVLTLVGGHQPWMDVALYPSASMDPVPIREQRIDIQIEHYDVLLSSLYEIGIFDERPPEDPAPQQAGWQSIEASVGGTYAAAGSSQSVLALELVRDLLLMHCGDACRDMLASS